MYGHLWAVISFQWGWNLIIEDKGEEKRWEGM